MEPRALETMAATAAELHLAPSRNQGSLLPGVLGETFAESGQQAVGVSGELANSGKGRSQAESASLRRRRLPYLVDVSGTYQRYQWNAIDVVATARNPTSLVCVGRSAHAQVARRFPPPSLGDPGRPVDRSCIQKYSSILGMESRSASVVHVVISSLAPVCAPLPRCAGAP